MQLNGPLGQQDPQAQPMQGGGPNMPSSALLQALGGGLGAGTGGLQMPPQMINQALEALIQQLIMQSQQPDGMQQPMGMAAMGGMGGPAMPPAALRSGPGTGSPGASMGLPQMPMGG